VRRVRALGLLIVLAVATGLSGGCARPPDVAYTYRVLGWGNVSSIDEFVVQSAETLDDPAGWAAGGAIQFRRVDGEADFTLYLASPANVASLSPVCSTDWSCSVGRSVAINEARWLGASPAWNAAAGGLRDYRHMVVNHEVGHWLGFGHVNCPAPGQPAPVMQQQSKDLQGCGLNPRPLPWEREQAAAARSVEVRSGDPIGSLDAVGRVPGGVHVAGWALDPDISIPIAVHVYVDDVGTIALSADIDRPDVGTVYPFYGPKHGFDAVVPVTGEPHKVCVYAINQFRTGANPPLGCHTV
jgi:hypothetical protein